jgi:hypothetical protein
MAIEVQLIPLSELGPGQAAAIRNEAINYVVRIASSELRLAASKLLVRDIDPAVDLGYSRATWFGRTGDTVDTYEVMCTGTMADMRYIGLYGVQDSSDPISVGKIRVNVGGSDKTIWCLEGLYSMEGAPRVGLSPSVILIPQRKKYTIYRYVLVANSPAQIVLKGFAVEAVGRIFSP